MAFDIKLNCYYPPDEAAELLGKKVATLEKMRSLGTGPDFVKMGKSIFYPGEKLLDYFQRNTFAHGAAAKLANSPAARHAAAIADSPHARELARVAEDAIAPRRGRRAAR